MPFFPCAHACHPVWQDAVKQVVVQLRAQIDMQQLGSRPVLGVLYISEMLACHAAEIVLTLSRSLPQVRHWVGSAAAAVLGGDTDYAQTGALAVMLPLLAEDDYEVFTASTLRDMPRRFEPQLVLVHGETSEVNTRKELRSLGERFGNVAMAGGLCRLEGRQPQMAWSGHALQRMPASIGGSGVQLGGLSGIAFSTNVQVMQIGMQAVKSIGPQLVVTAVDGEWLLALNGQPALPALLENMGLDIEMTQLAVSPARMWRQIRQTLVALHPVPAAGTVVRPGPQARIGRVVGLDPIRQAVSIDAPLQMGQALSLCAYDEETARLDIRRACAELWEELTSDVAYAGPPEQEQSLPAGSCIGGAIYIRNQHRCHSAGTPHLDAELQLIRHALGPVPLIGFSSTCEVDGCALQHLSAQLIVFAQPLHGWS